MAESEIKIRDKKIDELNKKDLLNYAKELKRLLVDKDNELKTLLEKENDLTKNMMIKDDEITRIKVSLTELEKVQKKLLRKFDKLERSFNESDERVYQNEIDINKLNQYTRRENIEIVGIPNSVRHEELESYVLQIVNSLGIKANSYDIAACHRLQTKDGDGNKNTIVRFVCRKKVSEILSKKKKLSSIDIKERFNNKEFFIIENLSPMNRKILDTCNYLKKKKLIANCWSYNGIVNFKFTHDEEERPTKLFHYEDIFINISDAEKFCD